MFLLTVYIQLVRLDSNRFASCIFFKKVISDGINKSQTLKIQPITKLRVIELPRLAIRLVKNVFAVPPKRRLITRLREML